MERDEQHLRLYTHRGTNCYCLNWFVKYEGIDVSIPMRTSKAKGKIKYFVISKHAYPNNIKTGLARPPISERLIMQ